jgi:hypothetical protein
VVEFGTVENEMFFFVIKGNTIALGLFNGILFLGMADNLILMFCDAVQCDLQCR